MQSFDPRSVHWSRIELEGPDAQDLLQRISTVDLRQGIPQGQAKLGFLLNPQGRILATFYIAQTAKTRFSLEFDAGENGFWKKNLLNTLDQFTFWEDYQLIDWGSKNHSCLWVISSENSIHSDGHQLIPSPFQSHCRSLWGSQDALESAQSLPGVSLQAFHEQRIDALIPWVDHEIRQQTNPLEIGLRIGIAEQKGCYPGQEVIEKMISIGSPAYRLVRIESLTAEEDFPPEGSPLFSLAEDPLEIGILRTAASRKGLAIIKKLFAKEGIELKFSKTHHAKITHVSLL